MILRYPYLSYLITLVLLACSEIIFAGNYRLNALQDSLLDRYRYEDTYTHTLDSLEDNNQQAFLTYLLKLQDEYESKSNWEGLVHVITELAIDNYVNSEFDSAISQINKAIQLAENNLSRRHPALAKANYYKAQCFFYKGDAEKALKCGNVALEIFRVHYENKKALDISICLRGVGNVYQYLLADYFKAEEMYRAAVEVLEFGNRTENNETRLRLYYNLGVCSRNMLAFEKALTYSNKALNIIEGQTNRSDNFLELCLAIKANALIELDRLDEAFIVLERAIDLNRNYYGASANNYLVQHMSNLGYVYLEKNNYEKAEEFLKKGVAIAEKLQGTDNQIKLSYLFENLGKLAREKGDAEKALRYFEKAFEQRQLLFGKKHPLVGESLESLGSIYLSKNETAQALKLFQSALIATIPNYNDSDLRNYPTIKQLKQNINVLELIHLKAQSLLALHKSSEDVSNLKAALTGFNLADSLVSIYQDIYVRETTKLRFIELFHDIYEGGIEAAFGLYQIEKDVAYLENAFYLMEHSKAKLLMNSFKKAQLENKLGIPDSIIQKERNINQQIAYYQQEANIAGFQEKLFELDREKEQFNAFIKKNYPVYFNEKFKDETFTVVELKTFLTKYNQALYSYYFGRDFLYRATVTSDTFFIVKTENKIKSNIDVVYDHLQSGYMIGNKNEAFSDFVENNALLSQVLLGDQKELAHLNIENILISPDFLLSYIPFEVLFTEEPHKASASKKGMVDYRSLPYLVKKYNLQYVYSTFNLINGQVQELNYSEKPQVLAFSYSAHKDKGVSSEIRKLMATIPGAPMELDAIKQFFDGNYFYGTEANETNFKETATKYDILHLAVHGTANPQDTYGAYLQFRPDKEVQNDGKFFNYELYNLKLKATLAVLSACESGMGKMNRGEGLLSIGRGFAYAGCPTTMMSLWQVNDHATASIVSDFYEELEEGRSVKEALKLAKVRYIKKSDELTAHPAYWAPMVSYGKNPQITQAINKKWLFVAIGIFLFAVLIFPIKKAFTKS